MNNKNQIIEVKISDIKIGDRFRKDIGDIQGLAESTEEVGLLQPIGITPDNQLIFGLRRLLAYRDVMRSETIPARIIDVESVLHAQFAENMMRKEYTISERVAIIDALRSFKHGGDRRSKQARNCDVETLTLDETSKRAGLGGKDGYARANKVIEKGIPKLVEAMDKGEIAVSAAAELAGLSHDEQKESMKPGVDVGRSFGKIRNARPGESHPPQSEYATPDWLFEFLDAEYHFSLDVASTSENARCARHFTIETNGLSQSWDAETVWCNPPFHRHLIGDWVKKAYKESQNGATVVMLIPSRFKDYRWWKDCCVRGQVRFLHEYVRFIRCGEKKTAYEDVTVVIFGPDIVPGSAGQPIIKAVVEAASTSDGALVAFEQPSAALANTPESSADSAPPSDLGAPPTAA